MDIKTLFKKENKAVKSACDFGLIDRRSVYLRPAKNGRSLILGLVMPKGIFCQHVHILPNADEKFLSIPAREAGINEFADYFRIMGSIISSGKIPVKSGTDPESLSFLHDISEDLAYILQAYRKMYDASGIFRSMANEGIPASPALALDNLAFEKVQAAKAQDAKKSWIKTRDQIEFYGPFYAVLYGMIAPIITGRNQDNDMLIFWRQIMSIKRPIQPRKLPLDENGYASIALECDAEK